MKSQENLTYYVNKLKNGERFSLARYGDGELYCMWGKSGGNSHGCRYSPELRASLWDSLKHYKDPTFIYGLQRVLPRDEKNMGGSMEMSMVNWYDSEIFGEAVASGELYPLIEALKGTRNILVANKRLRDVRKHLNSVDFIDVPFTNSFDKKDEIIKRIKKADGLGVVFLFSAGMGANAIIGELHGQIQGSMLDLGHIWDPFIGDMSRCDLEGKTQEEINKNLCP